MARKAGLSLGTKLVLGTVLMVAAAVAASAWYGLTSLQDLAETAGEARRADLQEAIQREATLLARNAAASSATLLGNIDYTRLDETARRIAAENKSVLWIALIDADGQVGAASRGAPVAQGDRLDDALAHQLDAARAGEVTVEPDPAHADRLLLGAPVFVADSDGVETRVGAVRIAFDASALERAKQEAIADGKRRAAASARRLTIFAGILLLVAMLLAGWQSMRISRPLRALSAQARHIAAGDFERRVTVRGGDELAELGESFNTMAASLGTMVAEIGRKAGLEREIEVARSIQGLMTPPPDVMSLGPFRLTGRCEMASACGGDWWSFRHLSDGRLLLVVGDVTGHGMPSAMIAATARGAVETLSLVDHAMLTPRVVLDAVDRAIRDVGSRQLFMTCFALILGPDGRIAYANAGHTFPYVMRVAGDTPQLTPLTARSNPLGSSNPLIATAETQLGATDLMILTSDGLTDRVSEAGTRFGDKRLRRALVDQVQTGRSDVAAICDRIVAEVNAFGGRQPVDDDITLVVVQYAGGAAGVGSGGRRKDTKKGVAA
ncbi:MAG: SpoIIE family protein phosphatase [Kofleriaceae bacterium]|nr:SpoIIE family protein phosphatase [Kofleriaceae bacterium]